MEVCTRIPDACAVILYPDLPPTWDLIQPCINEKKYLFHLSAIRPTIDIMLPNAEPSPEWSDRLPAGYYHALPLFLQFLLSQCILPPRSTKIAQMFGTQRKDKIPASRCHAAGWALKMLRNLLLYVLAESSSKWRLIIMVWSLPPIDMSLYSHIRQTMWPTFATSDFNSSDASELSAFAWQHSVQNREDRSAMIPAGQNDWDISRSWFYVVYISNI